MADVMTLEERKGRAKGKIVAWSGDGNNVAASWIHAAVRFGFELRLACPDALRARRPRLLAWARGRRRQISVVHADPARGGRRRRLRRHRHLGVDGQAKDKADRRDAARALSGRRGLMARPSRDAIFMHCLPAKRGEEVTAGVIDGPQSVVWDEAENRMHVQKGILAWCLG